MLNDDIDPTAIKQLLRFDFYAFNLEHSEWPLLDSQKRYLEQHRNPPEAFPYLKAQGLAFDYLPMTHDEAVRCCFEQYARCRKKHITDLFLASFSTGRLDWRSGLSAYAVMQTLPDHAYEPGPADNCRICGHSLEDSQVDRTFFNNSRFRCGSLNLGWDIYSIWFYLQQHAALGEHMPTEADFALFNAILEAIRTVDPKTKPREMHKVLRAIPGFKAKKDECEGLLETLGFCSTLETEIHKGYLTRYTKPGLAPSKSHSSDWAYPVDWWTGADGLNREALQFWFGDYKALNL